MIVELLGITSAAQALSIEAAEQAASNDGFLWGILILEGVLILIGLVLIVVILKMKAILFGEEKTTEEVADAKPSFISVWTQKLTDMVPVGREEEVMTDHEYDGIIELDNNLPPWWKMLFNVCIAFAAIYIGYYHFSDAGLSSEEEYIIAMEDAEAEVQANMDQQANLIDELNVVAVSEESALAAGKKIFDASCAACHGKEGQGGVGPNMTDNYWIHGGDVKDIFKTIKYGVPSKGMIPWESQLTPAQIQQVSSYILKLVGTEPPNPKEPQGDLYEPTGGNEDNENNNNMSESTEEKDNDQNLSLVE